MSGLRMTIGDTQTYPPGSEPGVPIVFPEIGSDDREVVLAAVELAGWDRGHFDGYYANAKYGGYPLADAIPAKHILLHQNHCIKTIATDVAGASLSARTLRTAWLKGYMNGAKEGSLTYLRKDASGLASPGGDPDQGGQ